MCPAREEKTCLAFKRVDLWNWTGKAKPGRRGLWHSRQRTEHCKAVEVSRGIGWPIFAGKAAGHRLASCDGASVIRDAEPAAAGSLQRDHSWTRSRSAAS